MREKFYKIVVSKYLNSSCSVLAVGAGPVDIKVFNDLGFKKVRFTNLVTNKKFSQIKFRNMENLKYPTIALIMQSSMHHYIIQANLIKVFMKCLESLEKGF